MKGSAAVATEVDTAIVESVRRWARQELDDQAIERAGRIAPHLLAALADLGVFGLTVPQAYGGVGAGLPLATRVVEVLAGCDRSVATSVGLHLGLGTRALVAFGSEAQKATWLPRFSSGACIGAFATTEPGSGSDLSKLSTKVTRTGHFLRLSGEKAYVTNGAFAGTLTVTARSDGQGGLPQGTVMVLVPTDTPGLKRLPEERKLGLRASSTTGFMLDDVHVPEDHLLGTPATGAAQLEHTLAWGRTLMSSGCVGAASKALGLAREHATLRRQFGRALIAQPVVRAQVARAEVTLRAMRALVAWAAHQERDEDLHRASVSAKVFCSEQGAHIVDTALQLHGAGGYMEDTGLALLWRDVRVTRIFEGANDVLLTHAGALEIKAPRAADNVPPEAHRVARAVERHARALRDSLGVRVFSRPELLHQLGQAVVWRDALTAHCRQSDHAPSRRVLVREARDSLLRLRTPWHDRNDLDAVLSLEP